MSVEIFKQFARIRLEKFGEMKIEMPQIFSERERFQCATSTPNVMENGGGEAEVRKSVWYFPGMRSMYRNWRQWAWRHDDFVRWKKSQCAQVDVWERRQTMNGNGEEKNAVVWKRLDPQNLDSCQLSIWYSMQRSFHWGLRGGVNQSASEVRGNW